MSPGPASAMSTRSIPWAVWRLVTVPVSVTVRPGSIGAGGVVRLLAHDGDPLAHPDRAVPDPPDGHPADVVVGGQVGDEELERVAGRRTSGAGVTLDEQVEERPRGRCPGTSRSRVAVPELGVRVDDRELDLVLVGAEVHEQLVDVVEDLGRAGVASGRSC